MSNKIVGKQHSFVFAPSTSISNHSVSFIMLLSDLQTDENLDLTKVHAARPEDVVHKREQFSISLRSEKKQEVLRAKRQRNIKMLSKAKFLLSQNNKMEFQIKDRDSLKQILTRVNNSIMQPSLNSLNSFSVCDLIQILRELEQISKST